MLCYEWIAEVQQQFGNWESNMACIQNPEYVGIGEELRSIPLVLITTKNILSIYY